MSEIHDVELATFCGRIGNLYGRYGFCPPFALRDAAQGWMARGIPLWHCLDVTARHLSRYAGHFVSGSGDRYFAWLSGLIEKVGTTARLRDHLRWRRNRAATLIGSTSATPRSGTNAADQPYPLVSPTAMRNATASSQTASPFDRRTWARLAGPRQEIHQLKRSAKSSSPLSPSVTKIDTAVAWRRTELAAGQRAAAEVEAQARCSIASRTYDRARKRLGITSRHIGFGRWAKYMIALPVVDGHQAKVANMAGAT